MLKSLQGAALKPQQKMLMLNRYLIPRIMHHYQNPIVTAKHLEHVDRLVRTFVKVTMYLPATTPNAYLYSKMRDGGLAVPCMRHQVGVIQDGANTSYARRPSSVAVHPSRTDFR